MNFDNYVFNDPKFPPLWAQLEPMLSKVLKSADENPHLAVDEYAAFYTALYDYLVVPCEPDHPLSQSAPEMEGLIRRGCNVYDNLHNLVTKHCTEIVASFDVSENSKLLSSYSKSWFLFRASTKYIENLFSYLHRVWYKNYSILHEDKICVKEMMLLEWSRIVFSPNVTRIVDSILNQVNREREGEIIRDEMRQHIVSSFLDLDPDILCPVPGASAFYTVSDPKVSTSLAKFYTDRLEERYIQSTSEYYQAKSKEIISSSSVSGYIRWATISMQRENDLVNRYLLQRSVPALISCCETRLIKDHSSAFAQEFRKMLQNDSFDDLCLLYNLLRNVPDLLDPLRNSLEEHVRDVGTRAFDELHSRGGIPFFTSATANAQPVLAAPVVPSAAVQATTEDGAPTQANTVPALDGTNKMIDPASYVETILRVRNKYYAVVCHALNNDSTFCASLDKACRDFANRNVYTKTQNRIPDLLARQADNLLRKGSNALAVSLIISQALQKETDAVIALVAKATEITKSMPPILSAQVLLENYVNSHVGKVTAPSSSAMNLSEPLDVNAAQGAASESDASKLTANTPELVNLGRCLDDLLIVFRYIDDKDLFQNFYTKTLAKRLVQQTSIGIDAEQLMTAKLLPSCGQEYISRLQRLFTDITLSEDLNSKYNEVAKTTSIPESEELSVMILNAASWPFPHGQFEVNVPSELSTVLEEFHEFYRKRHEGRKLKWLYGHFKGEVKAQFGAANKTTYTFQANMYQIAIMYLFNSCDEYSFSEIHSRLKIEQHTLEGNLAIMSKARILIPSIPLPPTLAAAGAYIIAGQEIIDEKTIFKFNHDYKNKRLRVNINVPVRIDVKAEIEEAQKTVNEDRKFLLQAAIVRIMKAQRKVRHNELVTEVVNQLEGRFVPAVPDIKRAIETLIEKVYMERCTDDTSSYSYIA